METLTGFPQQQRPAVEPEPTAHDRSGVSSPDIGGRSDPEDDEPMASSAFSSSSISAPPYWLNATNNLPRMRGESSASTDSTPSGGIMLRDNETDSQDDRNSACWARGVEILDHTIVNGSATNIGAFVVWNVRVEALNVRLHSFTFSKLLADITVTGKLYECAQTVLGIRWVQKPSRQIVSKL